MSSSMHIYIPTYRRAYLQRTLSHLPTSVMKCTTLVCDKHDEPLLQKYCDERGCDTLVSPAKTIAQKRAWIIQNTEHRKILMLDDDLTFCRRNYKKDGTFNLLQCTRKEARPAIDWVEEMLGVFAHVGISPRQGNNNVPDKGTRHTYRCIYALGYDTKIMRKVCKFGRIEHREDMDYTLQLFAAGYDNIVSVDYCLQQQYNNKGGASEQRKMEESNADADKLAKIHKPFVKVVEKEYSYSIPRKEVIVYWRKAFAAAAKKRKLK